MAQHTDQFVSRVRGRLHIPFKRADHALVIAMRTFQKQPAWMQ